jgi:hypothetical protein
MAGPRKRNVSAELNSILCVLEEENLEGVVVQECDSDLSSVESFGISEDSDVLMATGTKSLIPLLSCVLGWT